MNNIEGVFCKNIKYLCAKQGANLGDFETHIGVSCGYFSRIAKQGSAHIPLKTAYRIVKVLGVSLVDLVEKDFAREDEIRRLRAEIKDIESGKTTKDLRAKIKALEGGDSQCTI